MSPKSHDRNIRGKVLAVLAGTAVVVAGSTIGYRQVTGGGGGNEGGPNWAGTFDCYGSTPNCTGLSPKSCSKTVAANTLQTELNNATGGEVICLNAGSTGNISLSSKVYSSTVTVQPASTAAVAVGNVDLTSVRRLQFTGVGNSSGTAATMTMNQVHIDGANSTNLTFDHITYDSPNGCADATGETGDSNILFDHNRYDDIMASTANGCAPAGRVGLGGGATTGWFQVSNSHFAGGVLPDCSDGVQTSADGAKIGPGNEFTNLKQNIGGDCGEHVDPIQCYYGAYTIVTGNYVHDISPGSESDGNLMCHDTNSHNVTVTNNVWAVDVGSNQKNVTFGSAGGSGSCCHVVQHNVFFQGITYNNDASQGEVSGPNSVGLENVFLGNEGVSDSGNVSYTYNLNCLRGGSNCSGTGNIPGTPTFVSDPASGYYHYALAPSSAGYNSGAPDGKPMGICATCGS